MSMFRTVSIIGLGLIGSSIARAMQENNVAKNIIGYDVSSDVRVRASELGFVNNIASSIEDTVKLADIIILCIPIGAYKQVMQDITPHLKNGAIVTDVGSVKGSVVKIAKEILPSHISFVAGHPISGAETSGPEAGFATLFENRWCILTPDDNCDKQAIEKIKNLWESFGSNVEIMEASHHDVVLAVTSHLPHLIAYNIVKTASDMEQVKKAEVIKYSAGGFRDFTRIASSDPVMWRDIFLNNKAAVLEVISSFSNDLQVLERAISSDDSDTLIELFKNSRKIRQDIVDAEQDTGKPNFGRK